MYRPDAGHRHGPTVTGDWKRKVHFHILGIAGEGGCELWECPQVALPFSISVCRAEYIEKSKCLQEQLKELKSEIEVLKVEDTQTPFDEIHEDSVRRGENLNKYTTLNKVKCGLLQICFSCLSWMESLNIWIHIQCIYLVNKLAYWVPCTGEAMLRNTNLHCISDKVWHDKIQGGILWGAVILTWSGMSPTGTETDYLCSQMNKDLEKTLHGAQPSLDAHPPLRPAQTEGLRYCVPP